MRRRKYYNKRRTSCHSTRVLWTLDAEEKQSQLHIRLPLTASESDGQTETGDVKAVCVNGISRSSHDEFSFSFGIHKKDKWSFADWFSCFERLERFEHFDYVYVFWIKSFWVYPYVRIAKQLCTSYRALGWIRVVHWGCVTLARITYNYSTEHSV